MVKEKILFVTDCLSEGGAEKAVSNFANGLSALGYPVSVLIFRKIDNEYFLNEKVEVIRLSAKLRFANKSVFERNIRRLPTIRKIFKTVNPDFIFAFMEGNIIVSLLVAFLLPYKIIGGIRSNQKQDQGIYPIWLRDFFVKRCFKIFCQNKTQIQYYPPKIQKKCFAVPNPVTDKMLAIGTKKIYRKNIYNIVAVGRLENEKNFQMLIEAFAILSKQYPQIVLNIYGKGSLRSQLAALIKKLDCKINLQGWVKDISHIFLQADLFVLTSNYEGMPNALMEAMACGVPCIATDCPTGPSELIQHKITGLLVPVNDISKLVAAMEYMLEYPQQAQAMGEKGLQYIKENYRLPELSAKLMANVLLNCGGGKNCQS